MPALTRPGAYIDESAFPAYVSSTPGVARAAFIGQHPRGPLVPTQVNSWADFVSNYGGFDVVYPPSALALQVYAYFTAGGTSAIIIRSVAATSGPTISTATLSDQAGTPLNTLQVQAKNPGKWGNTISVDVIPGNLTIGGVVQTFTLIVKYGGASPNNIVERWENLTMTPSALGPSTTAGSTSFGASNYAPDIINALTTGSNWITVTDLNSATVGPIKNPATVSNVSLTTGVDGNPPSFTDNQTALTLLDRFPDQAFLINLPGGADITNIGNAITYCEGRGDCFLIADIPQGSTPTAAAAFAASLSASSYAACYYPYLVVADPYSSQVGRTRTIAPGGAVMGAILVTDLSRTVAKAPAGLQASLRAVIATDTILTNTDLANMTQANVNPIISVTGSGVVIYGARTLSNVLATRYVSVRRTLIYLRTLFIALTKFAVFETNDWVLWNALSNILTQFLLAFWQSGGLQGSSADQAFYVICDGSNNSAASIQAGIVNITVGVSLQRPAEFIVIKIGQSAASTQTSLSTSVG